MHELLASSGEEWGMPATFDRAAAAAAVADLFRRYRDDVHRFVARRLGETLAVDVTAEVFRIAIERHHTFDSGRGHERAWLYGIAANLMRGHWRTEERRLRALARERGAQPVAFDPLLRVDERLDADDELARVMDAVVALSADDRDLLTLFAWEGCGYAEIAAALEIPVGTVRSRLHRIRRELAVDRAEELHT